MKPPANLTRSCCSKFWLRSVKAPANAVMVGDTEYDLAMAAAIAACLSLGLRSTAP